MKKLIILVVAILTFQPKLKATEKKDTIVIYLILKLAPNEGYEISDRDKIIYDTPEKFQGFLLDSVKWILDINTLTSRPASPR